MLHVINSPSHLFAAHAQQAEIPAGPVPRRCKTVLDYLADADELGAVLDRAPRGLGYFGWTCRGRETLNAGRTLGEAARHCAIAHGRPVTVPVVEWWHVSAWLAEALEMRGEIVRRANDGACTWGCTEPDFAPDTSPVVLDIYLGIRGAFAMQRAFTLSAPERERAA